MLKLDTNSFYQLSSNTTKSRIRGAFRKPHPNVDDRNWLKDVVHHFAHLCHLTYGQANQIFLTGRPDYVYVMLERKLAKLPEVRILKDENDEYSQEEQELMAEKQWIRKFLEGEGHIEAVESWWADSCLLTYAPREQQRVVLTGKNVRTSDDSPALKRAIKNYERQQAKLVEDVGNALLRLV